jgi:AcrR family transcriptional regulator
MEYMGRKTKQDWIEAGFSILGESGASDLTIDRLTKRLGVTKGSFYHHFENFRTYTEHLLAFWERKNTLNVIESTEKADIPSARFERFLESLDTLSPYPEIAIRSWALQDKDVRTYVERIDQFRIAQAQYWFEGLAANHAQANIFARLFHTIMVGSYTVLPPVLGAQLKQQVREFIRLCSASGKAHRKGARKGERKAVA